MSNKFDYVDSEKVSFKLNVYDFSADYGSIDKSDILNIHRYLISNNYTKMLDPFIVLLGFSESFAAKCLFLNDEPRRVRPTLINMNPGELKYYPFMISLNKCTGSYKFLSSKICVSKKQKA